MIRKARKWTPATRNAVIQHKPVKVLPMSKADRIAEEIINVETEIFLLGPDPEAQSGPVMLILKKRLAALLKQKANAERSKRQYKHHQTLPYSVKLEDK